MCNPIITVAISIYNAEKYLDIAIRSVLNQTYRDFELLLINDGSTDTSLSIMRKYENEPRVTIINDGQNRGLVYRLNQSISLAKGEYYARMDADDIMHPERLRVQYDFLKSNMHIDVVGSSIGVIDNNNNLVSIGKSGNNSWTQDKLIFGGRFVHPSVCGKTKWFIENKYSEEWIRMEDFELWLRTVRHSNFYNLTDVLLFYREFGVDSIAKYVKSQLGIMRLVLYRSNYNLSKLIAIKLFVVSLLKIIIYSMFYLINKEQFLLSRRRKCSTNEYDMNILNEYLKKICRS